MDFFEKSLNKFDKSGLKLADSMENMVQWHIKRGGIGMEALRKEAFYTIDDIYALPDGERAELIDGQIYYMAPPSRTHQRLSMFLSSAIPER